MFLRLSTTAGLRLSEVCALRWLNLDLDVATVSINASIVTAKGAPEVRAEASMSVHGERLLALDAGGTVELLHGHRARCEQLAEQLGGMDPQADMFARTPDGRTPLRPDTVSKRLTALVRRLGHDYTLYGLRQFMATQLGAVT